MLSSGDGGRPVEKDGIDCSGSPSLSVMASSLIAPSSSNGSKPCKDSSLRTAGNNDKNGESGRGGKVPGAGEASRSSTSSFSLSRFSSSSSSSSTSSTSSSPGPRPTSQLLQPQEAPPTPPLSITAGSPPSKASKSSSTSTAVAEEAASTGATSISEETSGGAPGGTSGTAVAANAAGTAAAPGLIPGLTPEEAKRIMMSQYVPWVTKTYGDTAKTKTITTKKYGRIVNLLRSLGNKDSSSSIFGPSGSGSEAAKFKLWVKSKGFQLGVPQNHPDYRKPGSDGYLYVPTGITKVISSALTIIFDNCCPIASTASSSFS